MLTIKKIELDRAKVQPKGGWQVLVRVEATFGTDFQEILVAIPPEMVATRFDGMVQALTDEVTAVVVTLVQESTDQVV